MSSTATEVLRDAPDPVRGPGPPAPAKSPKRLALELGVAVAAIVGLAAATGHLDLLLVVVSLIGIIMLHELGHFLTAKRAGMKVTEYFVGFGPRLWSFRRGETEYGVKAVPAGGYVKIPGMTNLEEVDPADEGRLYRDQPFGSRLSVALAGSAVHFVLALVIMWALLVFVGVPSSDQVSVQSLSPVAGQQGPASTSGIRPGDIIVSVDGKPVRGDYKALQSAVADHPGQPVAVVIDRNGRTERLTVTPVDDRTPRQKASGAKPHGLIGVSLTSPLQTRPPLVAVGSAGEEFGRIAWDSVAGVGHLFSPGGVAQRYDQVTSANAANQAAANGTRLHSIVGIVQIGSDAAHAGVADFLFLLVLINVFLGIFNLFPMLPLDGGHVAIAVYERIRTGRNRVMYHADVAKLMPFTYLFVMFLALLIVPALLTDILHPAANPFG